MVGIAIGMERFTAVGFELSWRIDCIGVGPSNGARARAALPDGRGTNGGIKKSETGTQLVFVTFAWIILKNIIPRPRERGYCSRFVLPKNDLDSCALHAV